MAVISLSSSSTEACDGRMRSEKRNGANSSGSYCTIILTRGVVLEFEDDFSQG